jgi:hypothetical protein
MLILLSSQSLDGSFSLIMAVFGFLYSGKSTSNMELSYLALSNRALGFGMLLNIRYLFFIKVLAFCPIRILVYPFGILPGFPL